MEAEAQLYCALMTDAKQRVGLIRQLDAGEFSTSRTEFDLELACLSLRRVLELIAFSSLAANKDAYAKHHQDFGHHWKAERILKKLELINPDFFPVPVSGVGSGHLVPVDTPALTRSDFTLLYDVTSEVLHTWNPYKPGPRVIDLVRPVKEWAELIWQLLSVHMLQVAESEKRLIVQMHHPDDGQVHVYVAEPR
ncbi:hypothetical protein IAE60_12820 [Pseudoxanthomonas mexicana]|uniref:Uncharacterized protein n=1 Tax=Pseudoxanthomonas mexicana TaxID=128785 RepID=A0A7G9T9P5_PSEMX|nr:hypothetical protein [Pseudoxanthomonas mexicana]QNN76820.1 hypothetical protein IAE60_12820 [Pseudoxanthomonas mexicana]